MIDIQSDSRKIKQGDTFIALRGISSDGHDYIYKAIENGATKIIAEEGNYPVETLIVPDTRKYLNEYLSSHYDSKLNEMNIIAITGTNGKTTTAKLIHDSLNILGSKTAYIGTIGFYIEKKVCDLPNTTVDICDTYALLMEAYDKGCNNVVMEISSHAASMGRVETLNFDYAIFTNLTQDHLDYHKTLENYKNSKLKVFLSLPESSYSIINIDDSNEKVFLISLKAGGSGLNLTSADVVIHFDPWWNPAVENQASDRAHRFGQKNVVHVIKLIAKGTIEENIIKLQENKDKLIKDFINDDLSNSGLLKSLSDKDIIDLFS